MDRTRIILHLVGVNSFLSNSIDKASTLDRLIRRLGYILCIVWLKSSILSLSSVLTLVAK